MNYKKVLSVLEHVALVAIVAGTIGFYLGNHYGSQHVSLNAAQKAVDAPAPK